MEVKDTVLTKYAPSDGRRPAKVWDQDGHDYAIWENMALFETLKSLIGAPVRLTFDSNPNGQYQNRKVEAVEQLGTAVAGWPVQVSAPAAMPPATTGVVMPPAQPMMQPIEYQRAKHPDEQRAIRKAVALQCAVAALPYMERKFEGPAEVEALAGEWERWLSEGG